MRTRACASTTWCGRGDINKVGAELSRIGAFGVCPRHSHGVCTVQLLCGTVRLVVAVAGFAPKTCAELMQVNDL